MINSATEEGKGQPKAKENEPSFSYPASADDGGERRQEERNRSLISPGR